MEFGLIIMLASFAIVAGTVVVSLRRLRGEEKPSRPLPGAPAAPRSPPGALPRAFEHGATLGGATLEVRRIATLVTPSGRIVACDPLVFPDGEAFARAIPAGEYPVEISIARLASGDERIAAARVVVCAGVPARWELGLLAVEGAGYGVDAGVGCFMDKETVPLLLAAMDALPADANYYDHVLAKELDATHKNTRDWADHRPSATRRENVVVFSSGFGDGVYDTWWALDAEGQPLALVTDFGVLDDGTAPDPGLAQHVA